MNSLDQQAANIIRFRWQKLMLATVTSVFFMCTSANSQNPELRFKVDSNSFLVQTGTGFSPIWIKGINLGVGIPGTRVWELAASREDYDRWLPMMKEAGFNTIRVFTLHYPHFYEALRAYNLQHPDDPIYLMQGVWLEQEFDGFNENFYNLSEHFDQEIRENVSAIHGAAEISPRTIKAHGSYTADVSDWTIGWLIGREMLANEVITTNTVNASNRSYSGTYISINGVNPTESWLVERMDKLIEFEIDAFQSTRPVSFSNWPTLDPLSHPDEPNRDEDAVSVDITKIDQTHLPAGVFISYHVYPWYPEFIDRDPQNHVQDNEGINGYLGYLNRLRAYYTGFPVIIAEFGVPSSWGNARYAPFSGMNYGAHSEREQGEIGARLWRSIEASGSAGGVWFSWIDEWFKSSWISEPLDHDDNRRHLWHNIMSPEQNFGLIGFKRSAINWQIWEEYGPQWDVRALYRSVDESFLRLKIELRQPWVQTDSMWISLDTFRANLGEFRLPSGQNTVYGSEFAIQLTSGEARLFVKESYDIFGILQGIAEPEQLFRTTATTGRPWRLRRWVNNYPRIETQDIGVLKVSFNEDDFSSIHSVVIRENTIEIRIPWNLTHVTDPSVRRALNDNRNTARFETAVTDGIVVGLFYRNFFNETTSRFLWQGWNTVAPQVEYRKAGWEVFTEQLKALTGNPVSNPDYLSSFSNDKLDVQLYPNPTNGQVRVQSAEIIDEISIYTTDGRLMTSIAVNTTNQILDLSSLGTGVYIIQVQTKSSTSIRKLTLIR